MPKTLDAVARARKAKEASESEEVEQPESEMPSDADLRSAIEAML